MSTLLVLDKHERNCHIGREQTLSLLRKSVWIIKSKALVRKVIQNCSFCQPLRVTPQSPIMSNLPEARLAINQPPFTNTKNRRIEVELTPKKSIGILAHQ